MSIVLSGKAASSWKAGGGQWKTWSLSLITATLEVGNGSGECLHVLSCYAPTFAASRKEKNTFFGNLQDALSSIP